MKYYLIIILLTIFNKLLSQSTDLVSDISYNGAFASGEYKIFRSYSNEIQISQINKAFVFVEGYDPKNEYSIEDIRNIVYSSGLGYRINNAGYDIVILNFDNGSDYIQKNAFLLIKLINQINTYKQNNEEIVVAGYSMGGLVSRYALTYMEENNMNHKTKLFISYDSPQKGAHIPVGIQALAMTFKSPTYQSIFPDLADALYQFQSPAAKQMLKYRIQSATTQTGVNSSNEVNLIGEIEISSDFNDFQNEINNLNNCNGYPTQCRNIAIALGSWNSYGQRSNLDIDQNGILDFQHSGFPMLYINISRDYSSDSPQMIWDLNTCQAIAVASFQIFLSTAPSQDYPYYNERYNYAGLGNYGYATYWYRNSEFFMAIFFPQGAWSRFWYYKNHEPLDFAPGSYTPAYSSLLNALNSQIDCYYGYADNSTFIPTISALAFDTDDYFYDIANDPNKLDKTPFDNIIGVNGDNRSHVSGQTGDILIQNFIIDEITNNYGHSCAMQNKSVSGNVLSGESIIEKGSENLLASDYVIESGANVVFTSNNSITLKAGFTAKAGSNFHAYISECEAKSCDWESIASINKNVSLLNVEYDSPNIIDQTIYQINEKNDIVIFPNPNKGVFSIDLKNEYTQISIINSLGIVVFRDVLNYGSNTVSLGNVLPGVYYIVFEINRNEKVFKKLIVN